jgi:tetratricopeptide (TPR) repeat protein
MQKVLFTALAAAALMAGMIFMTRPQPKEWTTSSSQALAELRQGLDSEMKLHHREAWDHFQAALQADPGFVAPRLFLLELMLPPEQKEKLLRELRETDLDTVTPRERLLASYRLKRAAGEEEQARALLAKFLSEHPEDPYALRLRCQEHSNPQDAEDCYRQLIALEPNFVVAQNLLGYLSMGQGKFEEAEERFRTYQYLAPDQANPHDSMGELLVMLGRYDEAKKELEEALKLKPDFEASYLNLVRIAILQEDFGQARTIVRQVEELDLPERVAQRLTCIVDSEEALLAGEWEAVWQLSESCREKGAWDGTAIRFRADLWTGRKEDAASIETYVAKRAAGAAQGADYGGNTPLGLQYHLKGIRLGAEGSLEEAAAALQEADRWLPYSGYSFGSLKIQNALTLAAVLEELGRHDEAEAIREKVRRVNPDFLRMEKLLAVPSLGASPDRAQEAA